MAIVTLRGPLGNALEKTIVNRLKKVNCKAMVDPFRFRSEKDFRWRCEFWGKVVRSMILAWKHSQDQELLQIIQDTVRDIISTQTPDGCISSYPEELQLREWDLWGRKYVLSGLYRYYEMIDQDPIVLRAALNMVAHMKKQLEENNRRLIDTGNHFGLAVASILGVLVRLYRVSNDKNCLELADSVVNNGACHLHNIYIAAEDNVPPAQISNGKAYEMTACFEGLCEYLKIRPNVSLQKSVLNYYNLVLNREIFITGGGGLKDGLGEFWYDGALRQTSDRAGKLGETCVTTTWLHYCSEILNMTGDSRVADEMERSFYNALLGAMHPDGDTWMHINPTPLAGSSYRTKAHDQMRDFPGHDCCLAQGPEGLAMSPEFTFKTTDKGFFINGYENATISFQTPAGQQAEINITGNYPVQGNVNISMNMTDDEEFAIFLRIPAWSEKTTVIVNGEKMVAEPGQYLELRKCWKNETQIELQLNMTLKVVRDPGERDYFAVKRGPLVLAQDSRFTTVGSPVILPEKLEGEISAGKDVMMCCKIGNALLCDFASAGNYFTPSNTLQVWFKKNL